MRKFALALLALFVLAACFPAFVDSSVIRETAQPPYTHAFSTQAQGFFVAASTAPITAFDGPGCQLRNTRIGGPATGLVCDAPGSYRLATTGTVNVGTVRP